MSFKKKLQSYQRKEQEKYDHRMKCCETAALIAIKYGVSSHLVTEDMVSELWTGNGDPPSHVEFYRDIRNKNVKWFIKNFIEFQDPIWNSNFFHGLTVNAKQSAGMMSQMPSIEWNQKKTNLEILAKNCPFNTSFSFRQNGPASVKFIWEKIVPLWGRYDEKSLSFMAGVFAGGKIVYGYGNSFAYYPSKAKKYFKEWGIPIELDSKVYVRISPIWPCLLSYKMPSVLSNVFLVKKAYNADLYAPILWRSYIDKEFVKNGIPYLKSRRMVYYQYKCDEGAINYLKRMRFEKKLNSLDSRIIQSVLYWAQK